MLRAQATLAFLAAALPAAAQVPDTTSTPRATVAAAVAVESTTVVFSPSRPVQGTLLTVTVRPMIVAGTAEADLITGELAGERLHFERQPDGSFRALGAIPIDREGALEVPIRVLRADGGSESITARVDVSPGEYRMERLTVAPRFGTPPDSALAARMARESARAREVSRRSHETPRLWDSTFVRPRDARITSGFGHGREFNGQVQSRHMGVDFAGAVGAPIRATNHGVVALVDDFYLGGTVVYIDHGGGLVTAYLHLSKAEVAEGDTVRRGQVVGRVGATGRVTGPHLHWIARYGGITVDPLSLIEVAPLPAARAEDVSGR